MGVMVLSSCTDQPERIQIYRLSHGGFDSSVGTNYLSILAKKWFVGQSLVRSVPSGEFLRSLE